MSKNDKKHLSVCFQLTFESGLVAGTVSHMLKLAPSNRSKRCTYSYSPLTVRYSENSTECHWGTKSPYVIQLHSKVRRTELETP
ncbi:54S ribosomal protein L9 [Fusarium oxysporum f. sp. albedinis]|nr:54S ribosomal protein L9 [Fusarium oxysporum f. sp. albedinis]